MYERLLYTSRAIEEIEIRHVYDIIRTAHNRNSACGLTGGLLFLDGYFIQMLEGASYFLESRFERIAADTRHCELTIRSREQSSELLFSTQWMALKSRSEIDPQVFTDFDYEPGLPPEKFSNERVKEFFLACFGISTAVLAG